MFTESHRKVLTEHLQRDAFLYVRQSTSRQVLENTESTKRQYALRDRAVALGWPIERIHTIDDDLGKSGAHAHGRDGFQNLVSEVALRHAGIVLGLEASRLARNNADWQQLLELCALSGCLVGDEDGVYNPADGNDRLLLGLKGEISAAELHMLTARLIGGQRNKARRGALEIPLPIGLLYNAAGAVMLDPDASIQASVRRVFDTFRKMRSATAVEERFRREGWKFPRRIHHRSGTAPLIWAPLDAARIASMLHNPRYAGAFAYGRQRTARKPNSKRVLITIARKDWPVLIRNAHPGYISWDEFESNEATLEQNRLQARWRAQHNEAHEQEALLQGRLLCGLCGTRMRIVYDRRPGQRIYYYACEQRPLDHPRTACGWLPAREIDAAVSALLLQTLTCATLRGALTVQDDLARRWDREDTLRRKQLEQLRRGADLKRQRFLNCDPEHRLVADSLEADWNEALRRLDALQQEHERQRPTGQARLDEGSRASLMALAEEFPRVWNDPYTRTCDRQRMLAELIDDVTLVRGDPINVHVRFRGGRLTSLTVPKHRVPLRAGNVAQELIRQLDELLEKYPDHEAAAHLNALGYRSWQGQPFTSNRVVRLREQAGLKTHFQRLRAQGFLTAQEMARELGISAGCVYRLGRAGLLPQERYGAKPRCLFAPLNGAVFIRGHGGAHRCTPPRLMTAD
jgi:DNA invertase Pin-like site-specific DNA recombinase